MASKRLPYIVGRGLRVLLRRWFLLRLSLEWLFQSAFLRVLKQVIRVLLLGIASKRNLSSKTWRISSKARSLGPSSRRNPHQRHLAPILTVR